MMKDAEVPTCGDVQVRNMSYNWPTGILIHTFHAQREYAENSTRKMSGSSRGSAISPELYLSGILKSNQMENAGLSFGSSFL